jgi:hypothetical protein
MTAPLRRGNAPKSDVEQTTVSQTGVAAKALAGAPVETVGTAAAAACPPPSRRQFSVKLRRYSANLLRSLVRRGELAHPELALAAADAIDGLKRRRQRRAAVKR